MATNLVKFIQRCYVSLTVHLALVFHVFIAVAVVVCGHRGSWSSWYRPAALGYRGLTPENTGSNYWRHVYFFPIFLIFRFQV